MEIIRQNVGVDVDQKRLKISFQVMQKDLSVKIRCSGTFNNTPDGFKKLLARVKLKSESKLPLHFTMEVTGVYHEALAYFLLAQPNTVVHVELPNKTAAFKKSHNIKGKTDPIDAKMLGLMGAERLLRRWKPISTQMNILKKLCRERLRLIDEKTMVSNQLHAEENSYGALKTGLKRYQQRLKFLEKQIAQIEKELQDKVNQDEALAQRIDNVCTAKGLKFITVIGVVAETDGFASFENRNQLVSYAGYDVEERQSGSSIMGKAKISKKGNSYIRRMLYMPAMAAVRFDEHHKAYYKRIMTKSGIYKKASVAIQRKLLLLIYALFTKNQPFDNQYANRLKDKLAPKNKTQNNKLVDNVAVAYSE